jgi:VWFA-related protein
VRSANAGGGASGAGSRRDARGPAARVLATIAAMLLAGAVALRAQQPPNQPVFRASVELTSIDISVVDDRGRPVPDLKPADFTVRVDGSERHVVNAEWTSLETAEKAAGPAAPPGYTGNENATGGRLILIVVDEPNIRYGGALAIRGAVNTFIDHLQPSDRAAIVGIGPGAPSTPFTADRARLKRAVERLNGQHQAAGISQFNISTSEALQIQRHIPGVLEEVIVRECAGMAGPAFQECQVQVEFESQEKAISGANDGQETIAVLRRLLTALKAIDAPKTMIVISEGFIADDQRQAVVDLGAAAAAARTSIFGLKLDEQLFAAAASEQHLTMSSMDDRFMRSEGLGLLASASRGALFNVMGTGSEVFSRIESELSGYYLLGVESNPSDRDGRSHSVRVEVNRKGVIVRSRRALMAQADTRPKSARDAVTAAISTPLPISALPVRVATFSLQGPERGRVQLLIHADIGTDYPSPRNATVGYSITDRDGRMVDSQVGEGRLPPIMNGVPSALQFTAGASVPPGDYTLKLAVNEGDRIGSVEHEFHADVTDAGGVRISDLMAGGPADANADLQQPSVGYTIAFGTLHGYLEAYGPEAASLKARFELASSASGDPLISQDVTPKTAGSSRAIFSRTLAVRQLPPGKYVLRATLTGPGGAVKSLTRDFEVASPAVLMTSAESRSTLSTSDVYLPVADTLFTGRGFDKSDLTRRDTLQLFRQRVAAGARAAFDTGASALAAGDFAKAEGSFKSALDTDNENAAVLAYLAGVFAAAGRDDQAAGAWQTALVDGSDLPQIYEWLGDSLLRMRRLAEAQAILEEATAKWPADERFAEPMAIVYATFGQGQRAARMLERYIETHPDDTEALQMGVEWLYHLRLSNAAAHSRAEDLKLARTYADAYARTKGPQQALVRQWVEYLEKN